MAIQCQGINDVQKRVDSQWIEIFSITNKFRVK